MESAGGQEELGPKGDMDLRISMKGSGFRSSLMAECGPDTEHNFIKAKLCTWFILNR